MTGKGKGDRSHANGLEIEVIQSVTTMVSIQTYIFLVYYHFSGISIFMLGILKMTLILNKNTFNQSLQLK